jgi:quinone-modifying oxidoreductase subunit QmoA
MAGDDNNNDDLEDEFAAFEREAKEAAAKAQAAMAESANTAKEAESAAPETATSSDEPEEEDEFAAFEREAKAAAAAAMGSMSGSSGGSSAEDGAAAAKKKEEDEAKAAKEAAEIEAKEQAAQAEAEAAAAILAEEQAVKDAAIEAAGKTLNDASKALFGANSQTILVVGGGIAGVTAAIEAAETGYDVILLEKQSYLGGRVARLNRYFPKLCHPNCGLEINYQRIKNNPRLKVMTMTEVTGVSGSKGDYKVAIRTAPSYITKGCNGCGTCADEVDAEVDNEFNYGLDKIKAINLPHEHAYPMKYVLSPEIIGTPAADKIKDACPGGGIDLDAQVTQGELSVGAIIWATGWKPYDANKLEVYSYGHSPDIINNVEMERLASADGPTGGKILRPSNGKEPSRIAMIQCAGSRDINHLPYCSMICCLASLKHAVYVREQYPDAEVDIYYIDIRAHDKMTSFYERVKRDAKVNFIKSKPGHITLGEDGRPIIHGERTIGDRGIYDETYDLVVLATGMEPSLPTDTDFEAAPARDEYGFVINGTETDNGQFAAGVAGGPFDVALSTQTATAAALKAIQAVRGN